MNASEMVELLAELFEEHADEHDGEAISVRSLKDAGVLTHDDGLLVRVGDREYQLTVVRSR